MKTVYLPELQCIEVSKLCNLGFMFIINLMRMFPIMNNFNNGSTEDTIISIGNIGKHRN